MRAGLAWWLVAGLAGCRLGFDDLARPAPDGSPTADAALIDAALDAPPIDAGGDVELLVQSDEYATHGVAPIAGAAVLVDRGAGLERSVTDAAGRARFAVAGVRAFHVVATTENGPRVYTVVAPQAGAIELGGRPVASLAGMITFAVPDDGSLGYTIRMLDHCASPPTFGGAQALTIEYDAHCEGQTGRTIAFALGGMGGVATPRYLDAGQVKLVNHASLTLAGAYQPLPIHPVAIRNLPPGTSAVSASILDRAGIDLVPLAPGGAAVMPDPSTDVTTIATGAAPRGNALSVVLTNTVPLPYTSISSATVPQVIADPITFDARVLLPTFQSLALTHPPEVAWTGSGDRGTILIVETSSSGVQWDAYLDPGATSVELPALPADLGIAPFDHFDFASVVKLEVPGASRADLARTIDRTWSQWPHDASLFPAAGGASARILYSSGLGPP